MSLNGLDEVAVIEAYQAALAEAGGWFLLKYVTRDTVDLLQRGTGGVVEVRIAIEAYEEKSPVYGLVQYRRRKVVLKYLPEGTSRLLQARLTVQFQSVLEKFTPHDTVFNFTAATELTDSALSSACRLHTSIGSLNSSTSSLHRHRLGEITEDVEEGGGERCKSGLRHSILSDADSGFKEGRNTVAVHGPASSNLSPGSHLPKNDNSSTPASQVSAVRPIPTFDKSLPATPEQAPRKTHDAKAAADGEAKASIEELIPPRLEDQRPSLDSRRSSQSARPSVLDPDRASYEPYKPYKPKVKLGPRPSAQRPHTPGSRGEARPVANLPNSVRISARPPSSASRPPSSASHRPVSQQSNRSAHSTFVSRYDRTPPPPLPQPSVHISALYQPSNTYLLNRPASPALSATHSVTPSIVRRGPPGITPEKQRLMRALQLRKKQQMAKTSKARPSSPPASNPQTSKMPEVSPTHADIEPGEIKEDPDQHNKSQPIQADPPDSPAAASSKDIIPPVSATNIASQTHTAAKSIESTRLDSSLDSKDADVVSSTMDSESATSEATAPSLKSTRLVQSKSPVLPPITPQNRLSFGVSSPPLKQYTEEVWKMDPVVKPSKIAEEEAKTSAIVQPSSAQCNPIPLVKAIEEQPPRPESAPLVVADEESAYLEAQSNITIEANSAVSDTTESYHAISERRMRRREALEQDKAVASPESSDISDDESLYDELQTATVEEAKPVMVARSPSYAVFNRGGLDRQREHNRSISIQTRKTDDSSKSTPEKAKVDVGRSSSSALPVWPPTGEPAQPLLVKKVNVSTGISQRIKALEIFSGGSSPNSAALPTPPLTSGLVKKRMSSHSASETLVRNASTRTPPAKQLQYPSPAPTPTPVLAAADQQSSWLQSNGSNAGGLALRRKGDSISVTARIVRDPAEIKTNEASSLSEPVTMNLHRSPLVVEHEQGEATPQHEPLRAGEPSVAPVASNEPEAKPTETPKPERRHFSLSSSPSNAGHVTPSDSFTKRLSMTIRHARTESSNLPRSASDSSSIAEDKFSKESRKTRLMKRMSVLTAGSRRSIASAFGSNALRHDEAAPVVGQPPDSIAELSGEASAEDSSTAESHSHVVDIGDVNIQFPDTLLWKRRFMRIDDQGFLILTPPAMEVNKRGISRRFHLSDIKKPSLPPLEREELPWSIVLDFEDGSCLQVACESRYAQGQVLRMLEDAHAAYRSLYLLS